MSTARHTAVFTDNEAASNAIMRVSLDSTQQLPSPCNFFRISLQTIIWPYDIPSDMYGYLMIQVNGCRGANKPYTIGGNVTIPCTFSIPMCLTSGTGLFQYYAQSNIDDTVLIPASRHIPVLEFYVYYCNSIEHILPTLPPVSSGNGVGIEFAVSSAES